MTKISYSGYRFPPEIIHQAIWLYLRFTLSFRSSQGRVPHAGFIPREGGIDRPGIARVRAGEHAQSNTHIADPPGHWAVRVHQLHLQEGVSSRGMKPQGE